MASVKLSTKPIGSTVKLRHNGTLRDFLVVHQGKPSALYDDSCNGTWLLMKDIYENRKWSDLEDSDYRRSSIHEYLNGPFFDLFESNVRDVIKRVKIPYRPGASGETVDSGEAGLLCRVFLLSDYEVGWTKADNIYMCADGSKLDYFILGASTAANAKRIAQLSGQEAYWWLRSPYTLNPGQIWNVGSDGKPINFGYTFSVWGIRPALVLPSALLIADDGTIEWNTPPSIPARITVPETIMTGKPVAVSWTASADPDGDAITYELERAVGGGAFSRVYAGSALTHTETAGADWNTVQYRVRAVDGKGATAGYVTSSVRTVIHNSDPTISGTDADLGAVTEAPSYAYQVGDADAGDVLTVAEALDGSAIRTIQSAVRGTDYTLTLTRERFFALAAGQHRLMISVADDKGGGAARNILFTRAVAAVDFDTKPQAADARPEQVIVNLRYTASDGAVSVQVCNNGFDAAPTWEAAVPGVKHLFTNTFKAAESWGVMVRVRIVPTAEYPQVVCHALSVAYL